MSKYDTAAVERLIAAAKPFLLVRSLEELVRPLEDAMRPFLSPGEAEPFVVDDGAPYPMPSTPPPREPAESVAERMREERDELGEEIETCHKIIDGWLGLDSSKTTAADSLDTRMKNLNDELVVEKPRRVYYQSIVYDVCNWIDRIRGKNVARGEGVVCGTVNSPSRGIQDALRDIESQLTDRAAADVEVERMTKELADAKAGNDYKGWTEQRDRLTARIAELEAKLESAKGEGVDAELLETARTVLASLVAKAPLLDAKGEHGPKFDKATLTKFRHDMAVSAMDYAEALHSHDALREVKCGE